MKNRKNTKLSNRKFFLRNFENSTVLYLNYIGRYYDHGDYISNIFLHFFVIYRQFRFKSS